MKALLISDRKEIIDFVTPKIKARGFDLIHYRWIIKALDNIEEIQPDVIVLSAGEYPRHWKTLAGFVQSGIGGNDVKVYLFETNPLSEEDEKKAEGLGVFSFVESFTTPKEIISDVTEEADIQDIENVQEAEEENNQEDNLENDDELINERLYTNVEIAYNEAYGIIHFCTGKYYEDEQIVEVEEKLTNGSSFKYISLFDGNNVISFSATVESVVNGLASIKVNEL